MISTSLRSLLTGRVSAEVQAILDDPAYHTRTFDDWLNLAHRAGNRSGRHDRTWVVSPEQYQQLVDQITADRRFTSSTGTITSGMTELVIHTASGHVTITTDVT